MKYEILEGGPCRGGFRGAWCFKCCIPLKMGCYSAPLPVACTGKGCYITPRGYTLHPSGVIQYYLGAASVNKSIIVCKKHTFPVFFKILNDLKTSIIIQRSREISYRI